MGWVPKVEEKRHFCHRCKNELTFDAVRGAVGDDVARRLYRDTRSVLAPVSDLFGTTYGSVRT